MPTYPFYVTGGNSSTILYTGRTLSECKSWCELYVRQGNWGGWPFLEVWKYGATPDEPDDCEAVLSPADADHYRPFWVYESA